MTDLIDRQALYEKAVTLEAQALDYVGKLIERDGDNPSTEWRIWSAILTERTAFKHDVYDAPSVQPKKIRGRWQEITESDCSGYDPVLAGYDDSVVGYVCSVCHEGYEKEVMGDVAWNYCPNCGATMRGE